MKFLKNNDSLISYSIPSVKKLNTIIDRTMKEKKLMLSRNLSLTKTIESGYSSNFSFKIEHNIDENYIFYEFKIKNVYY